MESALVRYHGLVEHFASDLIDLLECVQPPDPEQPLVVSATASDVRPRMREAIHALTRHRAAPARPRRGRSLNDPSKSYFCNVCTVALGLLVNLGLTEEGAGLHLARLHPIHMGPWILTGRGSLQAQLNALDNLELLQQQTHGELEGQPQGSEELGFL